MNVQPTDSSRIVHFRTITVDDQKVDERDVSLGQQLVTLAENCNHIFNRLQEIKNNFVSEWGDLREHQPPSFLWKAVPFFLKKQMSDEEREQQLEYIQRKLNQYVEFHAVCEQAVGLLQTTEEIRTTLRIGSFHPFNYFLEETHKHLRYSNVINETNYRSLEQSCYAIYATAQKIHLCVLDLFENMLRMNQQLENICKQNAHRFKEDGQKRIFQFSLPTSPFSSENYPHLQRALNAYLPEQLELPQLAPLKLEIPPNMVNCFDAVFEPIIDKMLTTHNQLVKQRIRRGYRDY